MLVVVGSGSSLKIAAAKKSFPDAIVKGITFPSIVSEQPVGKQETERGAVYRAEEARRREPAADVWVSMENGMYQKDESAGDAGWVDLACVVILYADSDTRDILWSDDIAIPVDAVQECIRDGKAVRNWSKITNPHQVIANKSRVEFLHETLETRTHHKIKQLDS